MPTIDVPRIDVIDVAGARLYCEVRGSGPVLLIVPTGNGDATPFGPLASALAARYTVVTYDRRGFSRSPLDGPVDDARRLRDDVDDALRLIDHLGGGPAHVLGGSSGGIVALAVLERHPDRVGTVIAHEPPVASVLPDAAMWIRFFAEVQRLYRTEGPVVAMARFRARMGMSETTRPPKAFELPQPQLGEMLTRLRHNQLFWFEHECATYPALVPDVRALAVASRQLVLAGGRASHDTFPYHPNVVLARRIGTEIVDFPGGHVGYVTHPIEFARTLVGVIERGAPRQP